MFYFYDGSDGFDSYDYLSFNSLEKVVDHEYYNIKMDVQYPVLTYNKDGLPTIILPNGELFELNEYEVNDITIVEEQCLNNKTHEEPYRYSMQNNKEDELKYCTQVEANHVVNQAEEILINHAIDLKIKYNDLKRDTV